MNEEIKEILELLKEDLYIPQEDNREYKLLDKGDDKLLLDYITNLQQENERLKLKYKSQKDINQKLLSIDIKHKKINGELREENSKLEIALQNIQEDYDKRIEQINHLNEELKEENERLKNEPLTNKLGRIDSVVANIYRNNKENDDYKSRCEKASEYIGCHFKDMVADEEAQVVLNILQNGSDKE